MSGGEGGKVLFLPEAVALARDVLFYPRRAAQRVKTWPEALWAGLGIYAFSVLAAAVFYSLRPPDFPQDTSFVPLGDHDAFFWMRVGLLGLGILLLGAWAIWMLLRLKSSELRYSSVAALAAWMHLFYLLMFLPGALATYFRHEAAYRISEVAFSLWGSLVAALAVSRLGEISILRAILVLALSTLVSVGALVGLYFSHWVSSEAIKVLIFL